MTNIKEILENMTSRDVDKIRKSGLEIIINSQNEELIALLIPHRDDIFNSTRNLDLGGAFATNNRFYEFPIEIIDFHKALNTEGKRNGKCTCDLYLKSYFDFDPSREALNPSIELFAQGIGDYTHVYGLQCRKCGKRFHVSERHYHYIWYQWHVLTHNFQPPRSIANADKVLKLYVDIIYTALDEKNKQGYELNFHQPNLIYYIDWLKTNEPDDYDDVMESWSGIIEQTKADLDRKIKNKV